MTVQESVRRRLDEPVERFWLDDEIDDWCMEAAFEVARRTETLQTLAFFNVPAGTSEVALPEDLLRIHIVLWTTHDQFVRFLPYRPPYDFTKDWRPGDPYCYSAWGTPPVLRLERTTLRDGSFYLAYYRMPASLDEIPAGWEDVIVDYCEYQALRKDGDPRHAEAKALFETKVKQMIDTTRAWTDQGGRVAPSGVEFFFNPTTVVSGPGWDNAQWDVDVWS